MGANYFTMSKSTLLKKDFDKYTSIEITEYPNNRIASTVYAGDCGWVSQYNGKSFEEVCALERLKIQQKLKSESYSHSEKNLKLLLNFNQIQLF